MTKSKGKYYLVGGEHDMDEHDKLMDKFIKLFKKLDSVQSLALEHLSKHDYIKKAIEIVDKSYNQLIKQSKTGGSSKGEPKTKLDSLKESLRKLLVDTGMSESEIEALENKEFDADKHKAAPADKHKVAPAAKHKAAPAARRRIVPAAPSDDDDDDDDEPDPAAAAADDDDDDEPEPLPEIKIDYAGLKTASEKIDALLDFFSERRQQTMLAAKSTGEDLPSDMEIMMDNLIETLTDDKMGLLKKDIIGSDDFNDGTKEHVRKALWDNVIIPRAKKTDIFKYLTKNDKLYGYVDELGLLNEQLQAPLLAKILKIDEDIIKPNLEKFFLLSVAGAPFDVVTPTLNIDIKSNNNYYCDLGKLSKITEQAVTSIRWSKPDRYAPGKYITTYGRIIKKGYISWIWNKNISNNIDVKNKGIRNYQPADRLIFLLAPSPEEYKYIATKDPDEDRASVKKPEFACGNWWKARGFKLDRFTDSKDGKYKIELKNNIDALDNIRDRIKIGETGKTGISKARDITDQELEDFKEMLRNK